MCVFSTINCLASLLCLVVLYPSEASSLPRPVCCYYGLGGALDPSGAKTAGWGGVRDAEPVLDGRHLTQPRGAAAYSRDQLDRCVACLGVWV